ncbi:low molecular weight protein-tyrosine-phosphatase [Vibrio salinus]|uniref:low molecular weight protein-tyrosine-phosphatase n=1 Tax=Vibrio salinus TaxID=2899784 RepID=UPI001E44D644|nr:low molecular weight protein-tyrosine-phosphatase [Vibrio salinus]MCE0493291.1 low molecular weight phosphotyrosine protein phosphatase [Vibrio salinus]
MFDKILIICTGNICRSPYAKEKLHNLLPDKQVDSAGIATLKSGLQDQAAEPVAVKVAIEFGIDISFHRAKQVTLDLVIQYDLILAMEREQIEALCDQIPTARHKSFLLGHWIGLSKIEDPYNKSEHEFRQAFINIDKALEAWARKLL